MIQPIRLAAVAVGVPVLLIAFWSHGDSNASPTRSGTAPEWFVEHLEQVMAQGGHTVADNSAYQSAEEPFDAYGLEWDWTYAWLPVPRPADED